MVRDLRCHQISQFQPPNPSDWLAVPEVTWVGLNMTTKTKGGAKHHNSPKLWWCMFQTPKGDILLGCSLYPRFQSPSGFNKVFDKGTPIKPLLDAGIRGGSILYGTVDGRIDFPPFPAGRSWLVSSVHCFHNINCWIGSHHNILLMVQKSG